MKTIRIVDEPHAAPDVKQWVRDHLDTFNVAMTGHAEYSTVSIFLKDSSDEVLGGILGNIWGGWLHVTYLWVAEPLRRRGYGRELLEAAERRAIERGCRHVCLETFSFQAPGFYTKLGYEIFGTLEDYPPGHAHHYLRKPLV